MTQDVRDFVTEKANAMLNAFSCCEELKAAARNWMNAAGTDQEADAARGLIAEAEADIMPLGSLIAFAGSEAGAQLFGAEKANAVAAHGEELRAAGAKYCDCPACAAAEELLAKKDEII